MPTGVRATRNLLYDRYRLKTRKMGKQEGAFRRRYRGNVRAISSTGVSQLRNRNFVKRIFTNSVIGTPCHDSSVILRYHANRMITEDNIISFSISRRGELWLINSTLRCQARVRSLQSRNRYNIDPDLMMKS